MPRSALKTMLIVAVTMTICQIGWASFSVFIKATTGGQKNHLDALVFATLREVGAVVVLSISALIVEGRRPFKFKWKHFLIMWGSGTIGVAIGQVLYVNGVYLAGASLAGIMQPLVPVLTCFLSLVFRLEVFMWRTLLGWAKVGGILLSAAGTFWLVVSNFQPSVSLKNRDQMWGILVLIGQVFTSAIFIILQKKYIFKTDAEGNPKHLYPPVTATAYMAWFAALDLGLALLIRSLIDPHLFDGIDNVDIVWPVLYAVFVASALCYSLVCYANSITSPILVTAYWPLQSLAGILLSYIFLHEYINWITGICSVLIILGLFLVCYGKYQEVKLEESLVN